MGYVLTAATIGAWLSRGEVGYLIAAALFYMGAGLGSCAGYLDDIAKKLKK